MTKYLCVHPSHRRRGEIVPVDVSAQVRTERAMRPRPAAYLAIAEDTISAVSALRETSQEERSTRIAQILSGVTEPDELPVVLMSRQSVSRSAGRYEWDDLRATQPAVERVATRMDTSYIATGLGDDLLIIEDGETAAPLLNEGAGAPATVITRAEQATRIIPQGVFNLRELAAHLAVSENTEAALIDAIRGTPVLDVRAIARTEPWRVVIECPRVKGSPPIPHETLFMGNGEPEAIVAYGTPVDDWDLTVEASARAQLAPATEVPKVERRIWTLIGTETVILGVLLTVAWATGGLAFAARETPAWLGLSLVLAVAAIAFGAIPLFAVRDPAANMNDTYVLQGLFDSRLSMLRWAAALSAVVFGLALMTGVIPPLSADGGQVPAATVSFNTSTRPFTASVVVSAIDLSADQTLNVTMREYGPNDQIGIMVGDVTGDAAASGDVLIAEAFALDPNARYLSVLVRTDTRTPPTICNPAATGTPGCVVLAVPALDGVSGQQQILIP